MSEKPMPSLSTFPREVFERVMTTNDRDRAAEYAKRMLKIQNWLVCFECSEKNKQREVDDREAIFKDGGSRLLNLAKDLDIDDRVYLSNTFRGFLLGYHARGKEIMP